MIKKLHCRAKRFGNLGPFHIKPTAYEEEGMPKAEQRKSRLPRYTTEDNPVLGESRSQKGKAPRHWGSLLECPKGKPELSGPCTCEHGGGATSGEIVTSALKTCS